MASILQLASSRQVQPRLRGVSGRPSPALSGAQRLTPRLNIVKSPARRQLQAPQQEDQKEDLGWLRGAIRSGYSIAPFIGGIISSAPTLLGKAAQTVGGIGETAFDAATNVIDKDLYTSRVEEDFAKGREMGLKGAQLATYGTQRAYPLISAVIPSMASTGGSLAELATRGTPGELAFGRYDYGEPGLDYATSLRRGELGAKILEDLGNVMLAGRLTGAGSVTARAGAAAGRAGMPRLGSALRTTGYVAESPIGAAAQGTARLLGRALPESSRIGLLNRVGAATRAAGAGGFADPSQASPFRTFGQEFVAGRRAEATRIRQGLFAERANLEQRIEEATENALTPAPADVRRLDEVEKEIKRQTNRTAERKLATRFYRERQRDLENSQNFWKQRFTNFAQKGPVSASLEQLERAAKKARNRATQPRYRSNDPEQVANDLVLRQQEIDLANALDRQVEAKRADAETGRMSNPAYINDSFAAAVILASGQADIVIRELEAGRLTFDELSEALIPKETSQMLRDKGYTVTPATLQRALDYQQGRADIVDQVSIESALGLIEGFSNVMTQARQTGRGMVRGAASPFEPGRYPLPEYFIGELAKRNETLQKFLDFYVGSVLDSLLPELRSALGDEAFQQLGLDKVAKPELFRKLADTPKDSPTYALAYDALSQAFDELMTNPNLDRFPEGMSLTQELIDSVRLFLTDPMIYPAPARIGMGVERTLQRGAVSRDIGTVEPLLRDLVETYDDVLPNDLVTSINNTLGSLTEPGRMFDIETWRKLQNQINRAISSVAKQRAGTQEQLGVLDARRQELLGRQQVVENLLREAQIFVENVVRNPEQFFPTETPEVARLRGVASEAQAGLEAPSALSSNPKLQLRRIESQKKAKKAVEQNPTAKRILDAIEAEISSVLTKLAHRLGIDIKKRKVSTVYYDSFNTTMAAIYDDVARGVDPEQAATTHISKLDLPEDIRNTILERLKVERETPADYQGPIPLPQYRQLSIEEFNSLAQESRPFRPQTELEDNIRQLEQQKSEIATEVQQVERDISVAERRLAEAEALTPEDIRNLESERDIASGIESDIPYEQITTAQAKAELKKRLDDVRERIREEDKALRDATVTFMRTGLTEDLKASIDEGLGAGRPKALYEAFVRRFTKPKPPPGFNVTQLQGRPNPYSDLPWDSAGDAMARNFNLAEADGLSGITEAARRFKRLQDIKAELADLRKVEKSPEFLEDFRKEIEDELNSRVDDYRESQYREVDLTSPDGFTRTADDYNRILNDAQNPDLLRLNLETLRGRARSLQDQLRQIDQTIADNASDVQRRIFENENLRLRGVERRATQEAEGLVSANLQAQTRGVRGMLRGVGAVREGQPVLQRQFAGPLEADQARMVAQQVANEAETAVLRQQFATEDAALAEAQSIPGQATALSEHLAEPVGPLLGGERPISYIPAGLGRGVDTQFSVPNELVAEAMAPETIGGFEKIRTGTMVPYTPGQYANRVNQVLSVFTRNVVVQDFIRNQDFVTTVADRFTPEQLQALRDEATRLNPQTFGSDPAIIKDRIDADFQRLLAQEIRKLGLEPISPVNMPDPLDVYAERAPLKDLSETVKPEDINENTLLMTEGIRGGLAAEFAPKESTRLPAGLRDKLEAVQRKTGQWKSMVLPISTRWQVGDAMGNVLNAWVRGDIPPAELIRYVNMAYKMMRQSQTMPGGQLASRRQLMLSNTLQQAVDNPFLSLLESYGLQSSGVRLSDVREMMTTGTKAEFDPEFQGKVLRRFRSGAFAFNEFQNRLAREAVAMQNLDGYLQANGLTFDDVTVERVLADKQLEAAVVDAVQKANDVLGNFSELSPFERQTMRTIFPFWSWIKFINKAAMQLLIDQPDRLVFMAHLGGMTMEEDANGLWEFLKGKPVVGGFFTDLGFLNPYSDAIPFMFTGTQNPLTAAIEETQSISPVLTFPLYAAGETAYGFTGRQQPLLPTFSRPGYLEGRPGETTRTLGDTLGGLAYYGLKQFGGPIRNVLELSPVDARIPGTDVAIGFAGVPRFPQGSLRTTGQYGVRRLSPTAGRLSAVMRTLGMPAPIVSADVAQRASFEAQRTGRDALRRRLKQRRLAQR